MQWPKQPSFKPNPVPAKKRTVCGGGSATFVVKIITVKERNPTAREKSISKASVPWIESQHHEIQVERIQLWNTTEGSS